MKGEAKMNTEIRETSGSGIVLPGDDIDTDRIIPARFMKCVTFEGLGEYAFYDERFDGKGNTRPHPFNDPRVGNASILIVGNNFGCGSSREHAPQSLRAFGVKAIVGESFAEIFAGNCAAIGIPTMRISADDRSSLADWIEDHPDGNLRIDLVNKSVAYGDLSVECDVPEAVRQLLITGSWDTVSTLLADRDKLKDTAARIPYLSGFGG